MPRSRAAAATAAHALADTREQTLQRQALALLRKHPRVVWIERINTGRRAGLKWGFVGCPDLIGQLNDGRFLGVECKGKGGKLRDGQAAFIALATAHGAAVGVAYDLEDVLAIVGNGTPRQ